MPRTMRTFAAGPGKAASEPGPASKASRCNRARCSPRQSPRRPAASRFPTADRQDVSAEVPRPSHWGGYRLRVDAVELWVEGEFRIHDRARWTRTADLKQNVDAATTWSVSRLQP